MDIACVQVGPMGLGTWAWGNQLLWGYEEGMDDELQKVFNLAITNGVNLFDTADSYGESHSAPLELCSRCSVCPLCRLHGLSFAHKHHRSPPLPPSGTGGYLLIHLTISAWFSGFRLMAPIWGLQSYAC